MADPNDLFDDSPLPWWLLDADDNDDQDFVNPLEGRRNWSASLAMIGLSRKRRKYSSGGALCASSSALRLTRGRSNSASISISWVRTSGCPSNRPRSLSTWIRG